MSLVEKKKSWETELIFLKKHLKVTYRKVDGTGEKQQRRFRTIAGTFLKHFDKCIIRAVLECVTRSNVFTDTSM